MRGGILQWNRIHTAVCDEYDGGGEERRTYVCNEQLVCSR